MVKEWEEKIVRKEDRHKILNEVRPMDRERKSPYVVGRDVLLVIFSSVLILPFRIVESGKNTKHSKYVSPQLTCKTNRRRPAFLLR